MAKLASIVVAHRYVYGILVLHQLFCLLETLVLKIEAVFQHAISEVFGNIVKSDMDEYCSYDGCCHVEPNVCFENPNSTMPVPVV
ncbi:Uncharacterised protein [Segatella copri]|nr:Uncharacterised protein [Segatella copri]